MFAVASNTKAYTAAALAILVDEKKINWTDKVVDYLPYFKLYDPYVTAEFTIADLLSHRSGLATFSGDLIWYGSDHSREEVIKRAKYLKPARGFRSGYGYQNIMFMAAGEVIEEVTKKTWDDFVKERILDPLGMNRTVSSITDLDRMKNVAAPHSDVDGTNEVIEWVNWDNIGPAGSLIMSAEDASQWLKLQLSKGSIDDKEIWSEKRTNEMWTIHTPKPVSDWHKMNFPSKHFAGYGLGWDLFDYHGNLVVNHGGGYDGFISHSVLVPEENLGFIILTNNVSSFPYAMMYEIMDEIIKPEMDRDFGAVLLDYKIKGEERAKEDELAILDKQVSNAPMSLDLKDYAGVYGGPMYGNCTITVENDELHFQFEHTKIFHGTLKHYHFDSFRLHWGQQSMLPKGMVTFVLNAEGEIDELKMVCPNPDFDFTELEFKKIE